MLLAICGSLSPKSANSALLRSAAQLDDLATVVVWDGLAELPYFSPGAEPQDSVNALRRVLAEADAVVDLDARVRGRHARRVEERS